MRQQGLARLSHLAINKNARDFLVMHYLIADLNDAIKQHAHGSVLDIGCGNKPYEQLFAEKITDYTGCDVVQSDQNKVDIICPATDLKFDADLFDTVFTTQVIEHVDDPAKMLSEANRVMKMNGRIIVSAPFCWELHEEPYDFYRYSKYGLHAMLEKAGFQVAGIKANGGKWATIMQMNLNMIHSSFTKKTFVRRLLKFVFVQLRMTALCNRLGMWMDKKFHDELLTLNYVAVATKVRQAA